MQKETMALINCPECGKSISDKAKMCPHCGIDIEGLTFCENCKHVINPSDVKCPNCNTATPWARKCPECGEGVSVTDETCPNCGFNLLRHFGKVNITSSSIRTASTTTHQNNYYDELEEDVVRCPDCECELPENWEELRECPQCGCKFERPLSYKLKDNKNNFIIAGVGVLLCILGFITLRDSYYINDFYLVFNDGEFILSTLLMVVGIIMIIYAGVKSSYDFQNAKNISYGISGAVVFGILLTVLVSNGLISQSGLNDIHVAEAERVAKERRAKRLEAERLEAERLEAERLEQKRREEKRLEEDRLEAKRLREERLEEEARIAKQGPEWLQGNWTLDITGPNGIHISTYNLSINGSNARLIEGGNLKYDGEFTIYGDRMKVGPRTYILNDYSKTLEYSGMYRFRKVGGPSSNGNSSSSFSSPNDVLSYLSGRTFYNNGDALRISYDAIYLNGTALTGAPRVQSFNGARATIVANSPYSGGSAIYLYVDGRNNTVTQNGDVYRAR